MQWCGWHGRYWWWLLLRDIGWGRRVLMVAVALGPLLVGGRPRAWPWTPIDWCEDSGDGCEVAKQIALRYVLVNPSWVSPEHSVGRVSCLATFLLVIGTALLLMFPLFPLTVYSRSYVWFITLSLAKENFIPKLKQWVEWEGIDAIPLTTNIIGRNKETMNWLLCFLAYGCQGYFSRSRQVPLRNRWAMGQSH